MISGSTEIAPSVDAAMTGGIVGGAVAFLLIVVVCVVALVCYTRRKNRSAEPSEMLSAASERYSPERPGSDVYQDLTLQPGHTPHYNSAPNTTTHTYNTAPPATQMYTGPVATPTYSGPPRTGDNNAGYLAFDDLALK